MPQPLDGRVPFAVPVQVIGVTPSGTAFSECAYTVDVSRYGVRLDKVNFLRRPGDHVTLRYRERSARYRVAWVGSPGTAQAGQVGLAILEGEPYLWGSDTAASSSAGSTSVRTAPLRNISNRGEAAPASSPVPGTATPATQPTSKAKGNSARPASSQEDRRASRRYSCDRAVLCWKDGERVPLWGKLRDVSLAGCFVETQVPFAPGTAVSLMMMLYGFKIRARAQVCSHVPGQGMGMRFLPLRAEDLHKLKQVLERLSEPGAGISGLMNSESSIVEQLRCWFERNDALRRDQFFSLLENPNSRK